MGKILFIFCVNNDGLFEKAKKHILNLVLPSGFTIEVLGIQDAHSLASGYNKALQVDAEYKIYLHQDTFIVYKQMLVDLIHLFTKNPELGMIGLAGCVNIPPSGVWWEGASLVGQIMEHRDGTYQLLKFDNGSNEAVDYIEVQAIDGLFMATRVDIPWREDLFDGFHFYDASHSMEMQRAGYVVGVPVFQNPWCIHDIGYYWFDRDTYYKYCKIFVQHYLQTGR
jgi:hypothetical protein